MKIIIVALQGLLWLPVSVSAQSEFNIDSLIVQGKHELKQAVDAWDERQLFNVRAFFERMLSDKSYPWLVHYYVAMADYRLVTFYLGNEKKESAAKFIEDGIEHLQKSIELKDDFAEAHNLLSTFYGNKIGVKPLLAIFLGPKAGGAMSTAVRLDPRNPRNELISGWSAFFTPRMFGGGKDKAKKHFEKALAYFESYVVGDAILPDWGHEEAHVWLGIIDKERGNFDAAKESFDAALAINPDFGWVKYVLYPDLEKAIETEKQTGVAAKTEQ